MYYIYLCSFGQHSLRIGSTGLLIGIISGREFNKRKPNRSPEILQMFSCVSTCSVANYHCNLALQFHSAVTPPLSIGGNHYSICFGYTFYLCKMSAVSGLGCLNKKKKKLPGNSVILLLIRQTYRYSPVGIITVLTAWVK